MDTGAPIAAEVTSAASLPNFEAKSIVKNAAAPVISTMNTTSEVGYSKQIVVRGAGALTVTVTVNVANEVLTQKNLLANRGILISETAASHEG